MPNKENQSNTCRIYCKTTKEWIEVTNEFYREYVKHYDAVRKKEQCHGRCVCPRSKFCLCDGDCFACEFHRAGDMLSLDHETINDEGGVCTMNNVLPDPAPPIEEILCEKALFSQLFEELKRLMPEAVEIGRLRMRGFTDEQIAEVIGIKRTTFRSSLDKVKKVLKSKYPELF